MIVAVTNLETIPDDCQPCPFRLRTGSTLVYCNLKDRATYETDARPDWCPLTEIDETLPAQLAAAETTDKETEDTNAR